MIAKTSLKNEVVLFLGGATCLLFSFFILSLLEMRIAGYMFPNLMDIGNLIQEFDGSELCCNT